VSSIRILSIARGMKIGIRDGHGKLAPTAASQPEPIILTPRALIEPACGRLQGLTVRSVGDGKYAWSGTDAGGRRRAGTLRRTFRIGDDGASIILAWSVDVGATPADAD
jgi:hypothetical protein